MSSVAFSPKASALASGSDDQIVKLWNVNTGECVKTFKGHTKWVLSVAFSPNCRTLISGSGDETLKLWDLETGECLNTLRSIRPYEGMNIKGVTGITEATVATLKELGAEEPENGLLSTNKR